MSHNYEDALAHVNTNSRPTDLRITDIRFTNMDRAPYPCLLLKIYTNQGIVGLGELRDIGSKLYAQMLKGRLIGENPCDVDRLFRRIQQFGGHGRQGGGVSGIEIALWDIAGKAYGIPVHRMLGGRFRDKVRIYCDTDVDLAEDRSAGEAMGLALKKRLESGYTMLKMDVGINLLNGIPGALSMPTGLAEERANILKRFKEEANNPDLSVRFEARNRRYDLVNTMHPFNGVQVTEKGLDYLENYVREVRETIGYEVPLATDHFGFMGVEELIKLAQRFEKFNLAWMEDCIPWQYTDQWKRMSEATSVPLAVGEDIYLKDSFIPLLESGALAVAHPDPLTLGGIYESKKLGDLAQEHGVRMALHMAASPIAAMASAQIAVATENFYACEFHSHDVPWWNDLHVGLPKPLVKDGFIHMNDKPGLGIEDINDEVLAQHISPDHPGLWEPTNEWDMEYSHDRTWN